MPDAVMRAALEHVRAFLTNDQWGTYDYMEGSQIYQDKDAAVARIDAALNALARPTQDSGR